MLAQAELKMLAKREAEVRGSINLEQILLYSGMRTCLMKVRYGIQKIIVKTKSGNIVIRITFTTGGWVHPSARHVVICFRLLRNA